MGYTTTFTPPYSQIQPDYADWNVSANWSAGVPGLDATVLFPDQATAPIGGLDVSVGDLSLYGNNVEMGYRLQLYGSSVALTNSNILVGDKGFYDTIDIDRWQIDSRSVVGAISYHEAYPVGDNTTLYTYSSSIINDGLIGAIGTTAQVRVTTDEANWSNVPFGFLQNSGSIIATDGGSMYLENQAVVQYGSGQLSVQTGGKMFLGQGTSIGGGTIDFGGKAGTSLSLDTNTVSLQASLSSFDLTDTIDLQGLIATGIKETGTVNPTLQLSGTNAGGATSLTLSFNGDYSADRFHTAPDAAGTGTLVYVTQMSVAHPPGQTPPHNPGIGGFIS